MGRDKPSPADVAAKAAAKPAPKDVGPPKPVAKGHRQKGAGAIIKDKGPVEKGGVEVQSWQRIPSQLLSEYCQREKRPKPMYYNKESPCRQEVVLPDSKSKEKNLRFCPMQSFETAVLAKEHAALLALLEVQGNLPLERKLPEPYRTTWQLAIQAQADASKAQNKKQKEAAKAEKQKPVETSSIVADGSTSSAVKGSCGAEGDASTSYMWDTATVSDTTSQSGYKPVATVVEDLRSVYRHASKKAFQEERVAKQTERNRIQAEREATRRARGEDTAVFMSSAMRRQLEEVLGLTGDDPLPLDDTTCPTLPSTAAVQQLSGMGFEERHIRAACGVMGDDAEIDILLGWLCLQLPEELLPKRFQARGQTMDLQVHRSSASPSSVSPTEGNSKEIDLSALQLEVAKSLRSYGFRFVDCTAIVMSTMDAWGPADGIVIHRCLLLLVEALRQHFHIPNTSEISEEVPEYSFEDERIALESILEDGLEVETLGDITKVILRLDPRHVLDVFLQPEYPNVAPLALARCTATLTNGARYLQIQKMLMEKVTTMLGAPMLYELYSAAKDELDAMTSLPAGEGPLLIAGSTTSSRDTSKAVTVASSPTSPVGKRDEVFDSEPSGQGRYYRDAGWWAPESPSIASPMEGRDPSSHSPALQKMLQYRATLPAAKSEQEFLALLKKHQVVLVAGETGCGKTTQVPQFILTEAERAGTSKSCKIVVAQPRRIAAIGVATRVAEERGERIGQACGYHVRGDARYGSGTKILFCTTGIVLRQLQSFPTLEGITHLIIDEVHERHLDCDFLMALLRRLLQQKSHLKVILMSATMDTSRLAAYFKGKGPLPPVLEIPGFTHPVEDYSLDYIVQKTGYACRWQKNSNTAEDDEKEESRVQDDRIDYALLSHVVQSVCNGSLPAPEGAILIFLPGAGEIARLCEDLKRAPLPLHILPLHGGLPPSEQQKVFQPPKTGCRKVVVSTNVAETSITIPDITVVIDSGRVKETGYDPLNNLPCLVETWASKDSMRQRRGRAGRVRPGVCYRTVSEQTYSQIPAHSLPEIQRTALDQVVLQVKSLKLGDPLTFLRTMLDPPSDDAIEAALRILTEVQALDASGELTPQGWHQAAIPAPVRLSKMLLYGAILGVLEPILSIAAGLVVRSPFLSGARDAADKAKDRMCGIVGRSDHLILAQLYSEWESTYERRTYCRENAVSMERLLEMKELRHTFRRDLRSLGFEHKDRDSAGESTSGYWRLVRAAVCMGLYMNVVQVRKGQEKYVETLHGAMAVDPEAKEIKFYVRTDHMGQGAGSAETTDPANKPAERVTERVFLHPSSVNFKNRKFGNWLVYHDMAKTSKVFIRDCSEVSPYALLLAARDIQVLPRRGKMVLDGWIWLTAAPRIATLISALKERVWQLLIQKLEAPALHIGATEEVQGLLRLLMSDGMG